MLVLALARSDIRGGNLLCGSRPFPSGPVPTLGPKDLAQRLARAKRTSGGPAWVTFHEQTLVISRECRRRKRRSRFLNRRRRA
jgi:hypothetical protein